jgi:hypothetical protein
MRSAFFASIGRPSVKAIISKSARPCPDPGLRGDLAGASKAGPTHRNARPPLTTRAVDLARCLLLLAAPSNKITSKSARGEDIASGGHYTMPASLTLRSRTSNSQPPGFSRIWAIVGGGGHSSLVHPTYNRRGIPASLTGTLYLTYDLNLHLWLISSSCPRRSNVFTSSPPPHDINDCGTPGLRKPSTSSQLVHRIPLDIIPDTSRTYIYE